MSRRGENIYKRKDGRWEGRVIRPNGKYRYLYARTYKEVKEKVKKDHAQHSGVKKSRPVPISDAAELFVCWLEGDVAQKVKPSTYESYYQCIYKYVVPFFRRHGNERITEESVLRLVSAVRENTAVAESSQKKILAITKTALREILKSSPELRYLAELVVLPKTENREVQVFSLAEQRAIVSAALNWNDRRALGIVLCFYTGIRLGELCALKWSDIDLETGAMSISRTVTRTKNFQSGENRTQLLVGTPKSKKSVRKIPLPAFLLEPLAVFRESADEGTFILTGRAVPFDARNYQKLYKKVLAQTGTRDRKFHAIRHTFATRALELGVDIKTLSEILGHSNVNITLNVYAHSMMEQKRKAIEKFNNLHMSNM